MGTQLREKVRDISNLKSLEGVSIDVVVQSYDYDNNVKGIHSSYRKVADTSAGYTEDGGSVIIANDDSVYILEPKSEITASMFGAYEGRADNQVPINAMIAYASNSNVVRKVTARGQLDINGSITIIGNQLSGSNPNESTEKTLDYDLCFGVGSELFMTDQTQDAIIFPNSLYKSEFKIRLNTARTWNTVPTDVGRGIYFSGDRFYYNEFYLDVKNFRENIHINTTLGFTNNTLYPIRIIDGEINLNLNITTGWFTQNTFIQGEITRRSGVEDTTSIRAFGGAFSIEHNRFLDVNLEGSATKVLDFVQNVNSNVFDGCRFEGTIDDAIYLGANCGGNKFPNIKYDLSAKVATIDNTVTWVQDWGATKEAIGGVSHGAFRAKGQPNAVDDINQFESISIYDDLPNWEVDKLGKMSFYRKDGVIQNAFPKYVIDPATGFISTGNGTIAPTTLWEYGSNAEFHKTIWSDDAQLYHKFFELTASGALSGSILGSQKTRHFKIDATTASSKTISSITGTIVSGEFYTLIVEAGGGGKVTLVDGTGFKTINGQDIILQEYDVVRLYKLGGVGFMMNTPRSISTSMFANNGVTYKWALSGEKVVVANETNVITDRIVENFTCTEVRINLSKADATATVTVDVLKNGVSIFATLVTIDPTEETSVTAAVAFDFTASASSISFADDDEVSFTISGTPTDAEGLKVTLIGNR